MIVFFKSCGIGFIYLLAVFWFIFGCQRKIFPWPIRTVACLGGLAYTVLGTVVLVATLQGG